MAKSDAWPACSRAGVIITDNAWAPPEWDLRDHPHSGIIESMFSRRKGETMPAYLDRVGRDYVVSEEAQQ